MAWEDFCTNISISASKRSSISSKYGMITSRLNRDFWGYDSKTNHSLQVGSYGRGTATDKISDVDMLFILPYEVYRQYNQHLYNGQSALLQAVKNSIQDTYFNSDIGADGQVVQINFSDFKFEVLPVFELESGGFRHPNSNDGGKWEDTHPRSEINAINTLNSICNGNVKRLGKMARAWTSNVNLNMGGMLIDTLVHNFLNYYKYADKNYVYYDWISRDFFLYLKEQKKDQSYWLAPGSNKYIWKRDPFQYKATQAYNTSLEAIDAESNGYSYTSKKKWRETYGYGFPN